MDCFLARTVANNYPDIEFEDKIIDNMCMQLVQKPEFYDILVLPNLYGDVVSDLAAGLIGGLGLAPGANIGDEFAVFEATHGSAPKYKGLNKINPMAMILSGIMMLRHLGEKEAAERLDKAVSGAISETIKLGDFKGKLYEVTSIYTHGKVPATRIILVGAGSTIL